MNTPWHLGRMAGFDFETTDKDPETALIVTCALIGVGGEKPTLPATWLLNPGIPMNPEAIAIHGITDEYASEHGMDAKTGVLEIASALRLRKQISGEFWLLLGGVCSILFAIILMAYPGAGLLALVWIIGIYALIFGSALLALGFRLRGLKGAPV